MRKQSEIEEISLIEKDSLKPTLPPRHPLGTTTNPSTNLLEETSPSTSRESSIKTVHS